ncbi:FAD binding domain protein [Bimuria novae-zelandiae CBS 107.79]|uniref:FAD binding domain protein n=1 Tax=Bimuria novae-zelandiae CBS 107.79 TaxID=1447943 RepID=A0A6A5V1S2_9PLEO|nr:FAD binding domain protein [Bimuria novae-zelandiae CBS 107.79]
MSLILSGLFRDNAPLITASLLILALIIMRRYLWVDKSQRFQKSPVVIPSLSEPAKKLVEELVAVLPEDVILPEAAARFAQARNVYWDQQESERIPSCIVQPRSVESLSATMKIIKRAYDEGRHTHIKKDFGPGIRSAGLFAIRSGGHSPVSGAASMDGGVVIDLSLFNTLTLSEDEKSIEAGSGCRWGAISRLLDSRGLAVVGGRNSHVGVGGLLLAGGISFFSPQYGFAANNVLAYEVIIADGSILNVSATSHPDLWRALKGGSNNFGIVTRFTLRTIRSGPIWGGYLYLPSFQAPKILAGLHDVLRNPMDQHAAGPMASFTYSQSLGIQIISVSLLYTKAITKWPDCFAMFKPLWRFWSTCKPQSLTSAYNELDALSPPNFRQAYGTTTITNDPATIAEAHASYNRGLQAVKGIKGLLWTIVFQPLHPTWLRKGDPNPMGLQGCPDEPLVLVSYTVAWNRVEDDDLVHREVKSSIEEIEVFAERRGTGYPYRFHNYCAEWQDPFEGYGIAGKRFLQDVSRRYDPEGLFQRGCVGGFKLGLDDNKVTHVQI